MKSLASAKGTGLAFLAGGGGGSPVLYAQKSQLLAEVNLQCYRYPCRRESFMTSQRN